ncbi:MAG TPA: ABC transporter permease [Mycobacteriales bacterium]|jgi:lipooligosaccharide transport system permease protein|nr:ABC transporter permease [Mycobacteriales bacterium]
MRPTSSIAALPRTAGAVPVHGSARIISWARVRASYAYWRAQYAKTWRGTAISSVAAPVFYLAAMGWGLGSLVDKHGRIDGVRYLAFVGPGLMAATAMQIGAFESTWPVLGAIKWHRTYHGMLATPLTVDDVLAGHLLWIATRVGTSSAVYLAVVAAFGGVGSWWAPAALLGALLTGMAFAAPVTAFAATVDNESGFSVLYRFVVVPLFLFSGTFFPISQLPGWLHPVAYATPIWHGVQLCRDLTLGRVHPLLVGVHVGYLLGWIVVGALLARRTFRQRLVV